MKEYILDSKYMTSKQELHEHLQTLMKFPSYYGKNLDALYDVLTDIAEDTLVVLPKDTKTKLGDYGVTLIQVFKDASEENPKLKLCIEK